MKTIVHHAHIITMNPKQPLAQALCIEEGILTHVGSNEEILRLQEATSRLMDVKGQVITPAFIDSHSHFVGVANSLRLCDLSKATSFQDILECLTRFIEMKQPKVGEWIVGSGYDHNFLIEKQHPDRYLLDQVSTQYPILISHISSHMGVINSKAIEVLKLNVQSQDPKGGHYGRVSNTQELNGYLEENAFISINQQLPMVDFEEMLQLIDQAQQIYASYGITTIQEGMVVPELLGLLDMAAKNKRLYLDIVGYVDFNHSKELLTQYPEYQTYQNHLRLGGYKIFLDGSPQAKTAWMETPYQNDEKNYGYPTLSDEQLYSFIEIAVESKIQLLAHCNGDAAAHQFLSQFEEVMKRHPMHSTNRPVMIHAQLLRKDQLPRVAALHMIPSFFVAHTYYWGDIHIENFTKKRASEISPARSCEQLHIPYTFHQDSPVIMPNMLETLSCAVLRETKAGIVLGENEQITPEMALKAITINAAHQYFEESKKGSIEVGKLADLVILNGNPCTIAKSEIKKIQVMTTIKSGEIVYSRINQS